MKPSTKDQAEGMFHKVKGTIIDSVRLEVAPVSRDVGLISRDVKSIVESIHR